MKKNKIVSVEVCESFGGYNLSTPPIEKNMDFTGFSFELNPIESGCFIQNQIKDYEEIARKIIDHYIANDIIKNIYFIGIIPLARTSPSLRFMFVCYHNKSNVPRHFKVDHIGELPPFYSLEEINYIIDNSLILIKDKDL